MRGPVLLLCSLLAGVPAAPQEPLLRQAAALDAAGKCEEAEVYYRKALGIGQPSPALLNNLGNHYVACGQPDEARKYFERLLKTNPAHVNANLQLARILADQKLGDKALQHLAYVKDSGPAVRLLRAEALYWTGKRDEAGAILDSLDKDAGDDPSIRAAVGLAYARLGLYSRAEDALSAVLAQDPGDYEVLYHLGRAAARAGHYDRAQRVFETALRLRPDDADCLFELGNVFASSGNPTRAFYTLAQARRLAPQRPEILLALARAGEDAGYFGDSALAYDEYLRLRPEDSAACLDRALVYGKTVSRTDEGLKELAAYLRKKPNDPDAHYMYAVLLGTSNQARALEEIDAALRLKPDFAAAHYVRGTLLSILGRPADSVPALEKAVRLDSTNFHAFDQLGVSYLALDKPADAEKVLRQALVLAPRDPLTLMHLGRALMDLGREEEANKYLEQFQQVRGEKTSAPRPLPGLMRSASLPPAEAKSQVVAQLREYTRVRPEDADLRLRLGRALLGDGKTEEAAGVFRDLLAMAPADAILEEGGLELLKAQQFPLARDFLMRARALSPSSRLVLAKALLRSDGPRPALEALNFAPAESLAGEYNLVKAQILDATGEAAASDRALEEGLRHSASRPHVTLQAVALLAHRDRNADALAALDHGLGTAPDHPGLLLAKAILQALLDRSADAETVLKDIESRWPEWDRPYLAHALVLERGAKPAEARTKIRTAIALGAADLVARCAAGRLNASASLEARCVPAPGLDQLLISTCEGN